MRPQGGMNQGRKPQYPSDRAVHDRLVLDGGPPGFHAVPCSAWEFRVKLLHTLPTRWIALSRVAMAVALALAGTAAITNLPGFAEEDHVTRLRTQVAGLRQALRLYRMDHGRGPCQPGDENRAADPSQFMLQLTGFTNANGRASSIRDDEYRYGPYLDAWPEQAVTGSRWLEILGAPGSSSVVRAGPRTGVRHGWIYDARTGEVRPDLPEEWDAEFDRD